VQRINCNDESVFDDFELVGDDNYFLHAIEYCG